ncbi:MAG TPA: DUF4249 domain-containing protein [Adhaeribacter sp.]|nr:DUF4249 domain-containing protein [Adhaeribacter sp.]
MKTLSFILKKLPFGIIWLLLGLGFFSCKPDPIMVELPAHEPKLVVASQVTPGNLLVVQVSKSFSTLAGSGDELTKDQDFLKTLAVEHARVEISYAGYTGTLRHLGSGIYISRNLPEYFHQSNTLQVKDSVSGLECSAATRLMPAVNFEHVKPVVKRTATDSLTYLEYTLADPGPERNFFLISVTAAGSRNVWPHKSFSAFQAPANEIFLVSDAQFKDGRYEGRERLMVRPNDTLVVGLSNISEPYYRYLELYRKSNSLMNQLTGEPVNLPTNIQNGFGFFTMHHPQAQVFTLNDW